MKRRFSRLVEDTVRELKGEPRLTWDAVRAPKKEIYSTRSMGQRITDIEVLREALSSHAEIVGRKLRRQNSVTGGMAIFATNSPHDTEPYVKRSLFYGFTIPTSDTRNLNRAISESMDKLFRPGIRYYRCGVGLLDISSSDKEQLDLFSASEDNKKLMTCLDGINAKYGNNTAHFAAKGLEQKFEMRRDFLSPQYTTRWTDIPIIQC